MNIHEVLNAIENADNISAEIVEDNRQSISESNVIGCEYLIVIQPYQIKKRIGSKVRYGKYVALIIDNKRGPLSNHKIRIIRELNDFEKLILILKQDYPYILSRFSRHNIKLLMEINNQSFIEAFKWVIKSNILSIKYSIKKEQFSYSYDKR